MFHGPATHLPVEVRAAHFRGRVARVKVRGQRDRECPGSGLFTVEAEQLIIALGIYTNCAVGSAKGALVSMNYYFRN